MPYRSVYFWRDFKRLLASDFIEILWIFIEWTDFTDSTEKYQVFEVTDFKEFSKDSLLPFGVLELKIIYFHEMNRFTESADANDMISCTLVTTKAVIHQI